MNHWWRHRWRKDFSAWNEDDFWTWTIWRWTEDMSFRIPCRNSGFQEWAEFRWRRRRFNATYFREFACFFFLFYYVNILLFKFPALSPPPPPHLWNDWNVICTNWSVGFTGALADRFGSLLSLKTLPEWLWKCAPIHQRLLNLWLLKPIRFQSPANSNPNSEALTSHTIDNNEAIIETSCRKPWKRLNKQWKMSQINLP